MRDKNFYQLPRKKIVVTYTLFNRAEIVRALCICEKLEKGENDKKKNSFAEFTRYNVNT